MDFLFSSKSKIMKNDDLTREDIKRIIDNLYSTIGVRMRVDMDDFHNENNDRQTGYSGLPVIISLLTNGGWRNQTKFFLQKMLLSLSEMTPKIASPKMLEFILEVPS